MSPFFDCRLLPVVSLCDVCADEQPVGAGARLFVEYCRFGTLLVSGSSVAGDQFAQIAKDPRDMLYRKSS